MFEAEFKASSGKSLAKPYLSKQAGYGGILLQSQQWRRLR
jgi:hypothetical protein